MFQKINTILQSGGVIAFPTDTVWGLGCLPHNEQAVKKIYQIKHRESKKPLILMSHQTDYLWDYIQHPIPPTAQRLADKYFPGALTLVLDKSIKTPDFITSNMPTVGIRIPNNPTIHQICQFIDGHVLATTSANISGESPALTYQEAIKTLGNQVDFIIPSHDTVSGQASTVVGFHDNTPVVFRQGDIIISDI